MGSQLPANEDIAAPILLVDGVEIDKFMGLSQFMFENPSSLLETFPGTVVGVETNSLTNKVTFQIAVHSASRGGITYLDGLVKSGLMIPIESKVPTDKLSIYKSGQIIRRGCLLGLLSGGGGAQGGKNAGPIIYKVEGMNGFQEEKS